MTRCRRAAALLVLLLPLARATAGEVEVPDADVLAINKRMARFLAERIRPGQVRSVRLELLMDAIFRDDGLGMKYGNTRTKTAIETFESRSGNCLSFTLMFVAMARHLGLEVHFQEVDEVMSWDRRGDVVVSNRHMFSEVEMNNGVIRVDFLPGQDKRYRSPRRVGDRRVLSHYYNNLGAESLADGDVEKAVAYFHKARSTDATFVLPLVNLGTAYRRQGKLDLAEQTLLRALEHDTATMAAATNLASLYLTAGREAEARPLLQRVESYLQSNPYHHFRLGLGAARDGRSQDAVQHFKSAIERLPEEPLFHAELAEVYLGLGEENRARTSLQRAIQLADDEAERTSLEKRLRDLGG